MWRSKGEVFSRIARDEKISCHFSGFLVNFRNLKSGTKVAINHFKTHYSPQPKTRIYMLFDV